MKRILNLISCNFHFGNILGGKSKLSQWRLSFLCIVLIMWWKYVKKSTVPLHLEFQGSRFTVYANDRMDITALDETFVKKEYDFPYKDTVHAILDLGANIGDTAIFYSILFPSARVYAVEPHPDIFKKLVANTTSFEKIICVQCAIGEKDGRVDLHIGESHLGSSLSAREQNTRSVVVDSFTLETFCKKYDTGIFDILKFDIEGAEEYLLKDSHLKHRTRAIAGEMHDDLASVPLAPLVAGLHLENEQRKILNKNRYIIFGNLR